MKLENMLNEKVCNGDMLFDMTMQIQLSSINSYSVQNNFFWLVVDM